MNGLSEKLLDIERRLSERFGRLALFGAFFPEDFGSRWDLVVSSPWVQASRARVGAAVNEIRAELSKEEFLSLASLPTPPPHDESVLQINRSFRLEHGVESIQNQNLFSMRMRQVWLITSRDYFAELVRPVFPDAACQSHNRAGELLIEVRWPRSGAGRSRDDSRIINVIVTKDALEDHLYSDEYRDAEAILVSHLKARLASSEPQQTRKATTRSVEQWRVNRRVFTSLAAAV